MRTKKLLAFAAVLATLPLTLGSSRAHATPQQGHPPLAGNPPISVKEGMLTYSAKNKSARSILAEIGDEAGVAIVLADGLGDEQISVEFKDYRLDEAVRQILKDYDTFFFYGMEKNKEAAGLRAVWAYPAGQGGRLEPVPPEAWASTQEFERMLTDRDPEIRARAVDTLIRRKGQQAGKAVMKALRDENNLVRTKALDRALSTDLDIPQESLINLALHDTSGNVRFMALDALPMEPSLRWVAERALQDPSEHIKELAREMLRQLDEDSRGSSRLAAGRQQQHR